MSEYPFDGRRPFTRIGPPPEFPRINLVLEYDPDEGQLILERYANGAIREAIELRASLIDEAVLAAVVAELERRGYTVTPPEVTR